MKNIYISSVLLWNHSFEEIFEISNGYNLEGVEIWAEHVWFQRESYRNITATAEKFGIKLFCHAASWDLNICALNEGIRKQSIKEIKKSILLGKKIGAKNVTIHPGYETIPTRLTDWHFKELIESLNNICIFANKNNVNISIELMEEVQKQFITKPELMNNLLEHLPENVTTTLDIAHLSNNNEFFLNMNNLKKIGKIHISNRKGNKFHVPLGQGDLDCKYILKELIKTDLPMVIEGYDDSNDLKILKENLMFLTEVFNS